MFSTNINHALNLSHKRSSRHSCCWLMVITPNCDETAADKYVLIEGILNSDLSRLIEALSGQHSVVRILPPFMNDVSSAIAQKKIISSQTAAILLKHIGRLMSRKCDEELLSKFGSKEAFERDCIETVFCGYIYLAQLAIMADVTSMLSEQSSNALFIKCKTVAFEKQQKRHMNNGYLGRETFEDDLRRCFDDFMVNVKKYFGRCPLKF